VKLSTD